MWICTRQIECDRKKQLLGLSEIVLETCPQSLIHDTFVGGMLIYDEDAIGVLHQNVRIVELSQWAPVQNRPSRFWVTGLQGEFIRRGLPLLSCNLRHCLPAGGCHNRGRGLPHHWHWALQLFRREIRRRRDRLSGRWPLKTLVQTMLEEAPQPVVHARSLPESHFELGRVYIDIHILRRHGKEQKRHRMPIAWQQRAVGLI